METNLQEEENQELPQGFYARGAVLEDVEAAFHLFNRWSREAIQFDEFGDIEDVRNQWHTPGFDPGRDTRLVFAANGQMAGYVEVWTTQKPAAYPWIWGRVDPDYQRSGLGTWLMKWAEVRARQEISDIAPELRFATRLNTYRGLEGPKQLFEEMGYRHFRSLHEMQIEMDAPPPEPAWPEGIRVRAFDLERDLEAVYRAETDAFRDHFGFIEEPFEEGFRRWKHHKTNYVGFNPGLWFLAMHENEIAGFSLCKASSPDGLDIGWVRSLGVLRPWRKRGLGLALLQHSFGEFYRRGQRKVGLGVDAQNLTGALRLYEKAGMRVHQTHDRYEKEIRPGREFSVKSLSE